MRILEERKLCKAMLRKNFNNSYSLSFDDGETHNFGDSDKMLCTLKKIKVKDTDKQPKSFRYMKYKDMIDRVDKYSKMDLYVWKHDRKKIGV